MVNAFQPFTLERFMKKVPEKIYILSVKRLLLPSRELQDNEISGIHKDAFIGLNLRQQICLRNNNLTVFPGKAFRLLTSIKNIDLQNNQIHGLKLESLISLVTL